MLIPRKPLIIDSDAEQVPPLVSTNTRDNPSVGRSVPDVRVRPTVFSWNISGCRAAPVTGLTLGYLSLNVSVSNTWLRAEGPAIM